MTHTVVFRAAAEEDLFELYDYIAEQTGSKRAGDYVARIERACMALADFPNRGTRRPDIAPGLRTIGFERRVTIAFRVLEGIVEIVAIAYAGRDFAGELHDDP